LFIDFRDKSNTKISSNQNKLLTINCL